MYTQVSAQLEDPVASELSRLEEEKGISQSKLIAEAIERYLSHPDSFDELDQLKANIGQKDAEIEKLREELRKAEEENRRLQEELVMSRSEAKMAARFRMECASARAELDGLKAGRWWKFW